MAKSKTFTVRASEEQVERWRRAAGDTQFNSWVKMSLDSQAEVDESLEREIELKARERAVIVKKSAPQKSSTCKHEGYEKQPFCYRCGERR